VMELSTILTSIGTIIGAAAAAWATSHVKNKETNKLAKEAKVAAKEVESSNGHLTGELNKLKGQIESLLTLLLNSNEDEKSVQLQLLAEQLKGSNAQTVSEEKIKGLEAKLALYTERDKPSPAVERLPASERDGIK
jgi:hypothetical protein